jgi:hypothetical protein
MDWDELMRRGGASSLRSSLRVAESKKSAEMSLSWMVLARKILNQRTTL